MDEAVRIFIDLVLTCVEEVGAVPLYFVDGIAIMDPPSQLYEGVHCVHLCVYVFVCMCLCVQFACVCVFVCR